MPCSEKLASCELWEFRSRDQAASSLFAFTDAVQIRLQGVPLPGIGTVPTQAIQALPYLATVLLLAGFVGKAVAPKAIGQPYVKER
jgi:simple sugar transport system permease protein